MQSLFIYLQVSNFLVFSSSQVFLDAHIRRRTCLPSTRRSAKRCRNWTIWIRQHCPWRKRKISLRRSVHETADQMHSRKRRKLRWRWNSALSHSSTLRNSRKRWNCISQMATWTSCSRSTAISARFYVPVWATSPELWSNAWTKERERIRKSLWTSLIRCWSLFAIKREIASLVCKINLSS